MLEIIRKNGSWTVSRFISNREQRERFDFSQKPELAGLCEGGNPPSIEKPVTYLAQAIDIAAYNLIKGESLRIRSNNGDVEIGFSFDAAMVVATVGHHECEEFVISRNNIVTVAEKIAAIAIDRYRVIM